MNHNITAGNSAKLLDGPSHTNSAVKKCHHAFRFVGKQNNKDINDACWPNIERVNFRFGNGFQSNTELCTRSIDQKDFNLFYINYSHFFPLLRLFYCI